ncbi:DNA (cytosine-5-)-methyltransferase [Limosilactobacillus fermentum]|uniref:DNA (cytosine-5-)-methyltransferase n=1 Tax=Limosilactobacillus fermentum TaxID=1613 RepID=UPI0021A6541B|nr:DNA (cytosine-5-)-methyltransferase [Limosilactobacillus fermentum]MCT3440922.1 DNA (cytosine-5-)-methyltransferase [Limosilactobacillus fermentum]MCT3451033.1 DNA (cytosine-5-)-methyltransferase [Limosilactobacillus fermentum]
MANAGSSNTYLQNAKRNKNDEFYTPYETIEKEVMNYKNNFNDKTVFCNCDDPYESNFSKFFIQHFNDLGLKRLICISYSNSPFAGTQLSLFDSENQQGHGQIMDITKVPSNDGKLLSSYDIQQVILNSHVRYLKENGDFRSTESINYLKQSDIVVTNPPFSLFRELISLLMEYKKKFLLIGNMNAINYKEIFPLIKNNKAWLGYHNGEMAFMVPKDSKPRKTRFWIDENGQKWRSLGNAMWFTNMDVKYRHHAMKLTASYNSEKYPTFDNYNAIFVPTVNDIPNDYDGVMAVPITILSKYSPEQFEIIGEANHGSDNPYDLFKPIINGKLMYKRILIRKKTAPQKINEFNILDLFSGAGGLSYGMEKNKHFKTKVALDFNQKAGETFKKNMPQTDVIIGDITDKDVKDKVIDKSKKAHVNMIIGGPPCQGFSLKGKKLGLKDPRNFLFVEYLNIVDKLQPEVFVIENVKALLSTSAGWFKDQIINTINQMGYNVHYGVLNAKDFGVPQSRQRAIFICSKGKDIPLPKPTVDSPTTVRDAISDLAYLNSGEGTFEQEYSTKATSKYQEMMRNGSTKLYNHKATNHKQVAIDKLKLIPPEKGKEYLPKSMLGNQKFKSTWGRLVWDEVSPTIDTRFDAASNGKNNHPFLNRAITPREAARIQSFDDKFIFYGSKVYVRQQIGNAVPPLLAKAIADQINKTIGS